MAPSESLAPPPKIERRLTIGQLSQRSRLPISTLRYYHQIGLLLPDHVDPSTGYRYYRHDQISSAVLVAELRLLGLGPAAIATVPSSPTADRRSKLEQLRTVITARIDTERRHLVRLDALIAESETEAALAQPTFLRSWPTTTAQLMGEVRADQTAGDVRRLLVRLRRMSEGTEGRYGAVFPLAVKAGTLAVTVYCEDPTNQDRGQGLAVTHRGRSAQLWQAYAALLSDVDRRGERPSGQVIERYLESDGDQLTTQVIVPLLPSGVDQRGAFAPAAHREGG